jgi:hypothetical protein
MATDPNALTPYHAIAIASVTARLTAFLSTLEL